ncbi:hypothetical protein D805_0546 [Bifidobacterium thermophilum RBL67]|uniref:Uncharacterized protein n=1 Tax=Bifidobacterium thermophilum RBL67 TaxID=1254439 RepID=M4RE27_9BIFI|nr:hypothetical protein D805_0546 [Bifidobacterium thermophilum RBL67]
MHIGALDGFLAGCGAALAFFLIRHIDYSNEDHGRSAGRKNQTGIT